MKISLFALAGALALGGVGGQSPPPAPVMQKIPVAPSYLPFVAAKNADTLDMGVQSATRDRLGRPMSIISRDDKRAREMKNGYLTMFATWAQTTLRVPLGWYAVESKRNVDESLIYSPGQTVQIVARAPIENSVYQSDRDAFEKFKAHSVEATRARLQKMGFRPGPIELIDLMGGSFAVRVPRMLDRDGEAFSYLERFSQRTPQTERDEFWAAYGKGQPVANLQLPLALSLRTTPDKLDKYLPLLGLIARDAGLNWTTEDSLSLEAFRARAPVAAQFTAVADEAVALLKAGDIAGFQRRFPGAFEGEDAAQIAAHLRAVTVPFFQKLPAKIERENYSVARDKDPVEPFLQVSLVRDFQLSEDNFPSYVIVMERVGGRIELSSIGTTDDELIAP